MKFVASLGNEEQKPKYDKDALFKESPPIDLLKTENGFETLNNKEDIKVTTQPQAEIITSADQLESTSERDSDIEEIFGNINQQKQEVEPIAPIQTEQTQIAIPGNTPKRKGKSIIILVLLALLLVGSSMYYFVFSSPKKLSVEIMNRVYEAYYKNVDLKNNIVQSSSFNTYGTINLATTIDEYKKYDNMLVDYVLSADEITKRVNTSIKLTRDDSILYDVLLYLDGANSLVNYNGIFKDALNFDGTAYSEMIFSMVDTKDYKEVDYDYLLKVVFNSISEGAPKDSISRKMVFEKIGDSKKVAYKVEVDVNTISIYKILSHVVSVIKNDSKALKDFSLLIGTDKEGTQVYLDEIINNQPKENVDYGKVVIYINPLNKKIYSLSLTNDENIVNIDCGNEENTITVSSKDNDYNSKIVYANDRSNFDAEINMTNEEIISTIQLNIKNYNLKEGYNNMDYKVTYYPDRNNASELVVLTIKNHIKLNDGIAENKITKYENPKLFNKEDREDFINRMKKAPALIRGFFEEMSGLSVPEDEEKTEKTEIDLLDNL